MTNHKNLRSRVEQAEALTDQSKVLDYDEFKRPTRVKVPSWSTPNKWYIVELTRIDSGSFIMGSCQCKGNQAETACKHVMAAVILAARERNGHVAFCASPEHATKRANIDGQVVRVVGQGTGSVWVVMTRAGKENAGPIEPSGYKPPSKQFLGDKAFPPSPSKKGGIGFK